MVWIIPDGGNYYGSLNALSRQKSFAGFFYVIRLLPRMSLLGKVGKALVDVIFVNWMLSLITILVWNVHSHSVFG